MHSRPIMVFLTIAASLLGLGGCNMYVIDFKNKLPDGTVLEPQAEAPPPPEPVMPIEGSQAVAFMDSTTAQLEGCRVITGMQIAHSGSFDDGLTKLRNRAVRINANRIIPLRLVESRVKGAPHHLSAKLVRCPETGAETGAGAGTQTTAETGNG